jgi:ribosomal protein L32
LQGLTDATHDMTAESMRRLRLRRAGLLPALPECTTCGCQVRSNRTAPLCSRCWRLSDAGREWNRRRMAAKRLTMAEDGVGSVQAGQPGTPTRET